jgi:hypothetical protein
MFIYHFAKDTIFTKKRWIFLSQIGARHDELREITFYPINKMRMILFPYFFLSKHFPVWSINIWLKGTTVRHYFLWERLLNGEKLKRSKCTAVNDPSAGVCPPPTPPCLCLSTSACGKRRRRGCWVIWVRISNSRRVALPLHRSRYPDIARKNRPIDAKLTFIPMTVAWLFGLPPLCL